MNKIFVLYGTLIITMGVIPFPLLLFSTSATVFAPIPPRMGNIKYYRLWFIRRNGTETLKWSTTFSVWLLDSEETSNWFLFLSHCGMKCQACFHLFKLYFTLREFQDIRCPRFIFKLIFFRKKKVRTVCFCEFSFPALFKQSTVKYLKRMRRQFKYAQSYYGIPSSSFYLSSDHSASMNPSPELLQLIQQQKSRFKIMNL